MLQIKSKAAFFAFLLLSGGLVASAAYIGNFNELAPTEIASHDGGAENSLEEVSSYNYLFNLYL